MASQTGVNISPKNLKLSVFQSRVFSNCLAYLIFVKDDKDGVRVNFFAWCKFFCPV